MQVAPSPSSSTTKIGGPAEKNWELPKEYSEVHLKKSSDHEHKPEVEVPAEQKPDYKAIELKHNATPVEKPPKEERRPSFASVELRKSQRSLVDSKEETIIDDEKKHALPEEYNNVQLKSSNHSQRKAEVEVLTEEKPDYTAVPLKAAPVKPKLQEKEAMEQQPSYSAASLKSTGQADVLKSGGDVQKPVKQNENEARLSYSSVQLKKSIRNIDQPKGFDDDEGSKHALPDEFNTVQLKKSSDHVRKAEVEVMAEEKPEYTAVALKKAAVTDEKKKPIESTRASYVEVQLKATGQGNAVKSGGDVHKKIEPKSEPEPTYSKVQLKGTGLGDVLKSGGDVKKEKEGEENKYQLPEEFATVSLKKAAPVSKTTEDHPEAKPEYAAVALKKAAPINKTEANLEPESKPAYAEKQLKKAAPIEKKSVESRRASYVAVQLKATGQGDAVKNGGDVYKKEEIKSEPEPSYSAVQLKATGQGDAVKSGGDIKKEKEKDQHKYQLPEEFAAVSLKKAAPVVKTHEAQVEAKPEYAAVALKKAEPILKAEVDVHPEAKPAYAERQLKKAAPIEKKPMESRRASYVEVQLKATGQGDAVKSGGDVHKKEESKPESEPSYSAVQLKGTGLGDVVKSGGDVKKEMKEDPNKYQLPEEYAAVSLKKAAPVVKATKNHSEVAPEYAAVSLKKAEPTIKTSSEEHPEAKPEYAAVALKKAETIVKTEADLHPEVKPAYAEKQLKKAIPVEKKPAEPSRASYVEVQLKATGQGDAVKSGKDVEGHKLEKDFSLPKEFSNVQLKRGVDHAPEF